jgi:hypothetical protein
VTSVRHTKTDEKKKKTCGQRTLKNVLLRTNAVACRNLEIHMTAYVKINYRKPSVKHN